MKEVKIENLKVGDILLDKNDIKVIVDDIEPFDDRELMVYVRGCEDGILRIGSSPKKAMVRIIKEVSKVEISKTNLKARILAVFQRKTLTEIAFEVERTNNFTLKTLTVAFKAAGYSNRIARKEASQIMLSGFWRKEDV